MSCKIVAGVFVKNMSRSSARWIKIGFIQERDKALKLYSSYVSYLIKQVHRRRVKRLAIIGNR